MKSALFVDFDNVFSGLSRLDPAYAEAFARNPVRWMDWLTRALPLPLDPDAPVARRILVRRCYLNPVVYQRYRFGFSRAGFEIVDCPPMTMAGKTSTDIHMVLDMVDVLQSSTRYDEFIVFSADADFTPVLRKLRRDDRRTTVFAAGATSAAYDASADLIIAPETFVQDALGLGEDDHAHPLPPDTGALLAQAEAVTFEAVEKASAPVLLPALTKILATRIPALVETRWAGLGTFTALLLELRLSPLRVDREKNWVLDPRRLRAEPEPVAEAVGDPVAASATDAAEQRAQVARWVVDEVRSSERPVAVARLAQAVRGQLPGIEASWLGSGSFKRLLGTLETPGVCVSWANQAGIAYDPLRHAAPSVPSMAAQGADADPRRALVEPLLEVANLPALGAAQCRSALSSLAHALGEAPFVMAQVTKRARDLSLDAQVPVARADINALLRALLFNALDPAQPGLDAASLAARTRELVLAACRREGMTVSDGAAEALRDWLGAPPAL